MIRGGRRSRYLLDSIGLMIIAGLEDLGWFGATVHDDPPGLRRHQPLRFVPRPAKWDVPVVPNAFSIGIEESAEDGGGLGGDVEDAMHVYIDLFAENESLGWELATDIADLCDGKRPAQGRDNPYLDVYDFNQATPMPFTVVEIEDVRIDRAGVDTHEWQRHWFMVSFRAIDEYRDEHLDRIPDGDWSDLRAAWVRIQAIESNP